jgi:hypothetical protein
MAVHSLLISLLLTQSTAAAGPPEAAACATAPLVKEIAEGTPDVAATAFTTLARCAPAVAKKEAPKAWARLVQGEPTDQASVAAIEIGAQDAVATWITGLQSDERARAIKALGAACGASPAVQGFFVERAAKLGDDFWDQRWYRALEACPAPEVQGLLVAQLEKGAADRARWGGVLEVYARGQKGAALPTLTGLLGKNTDAELQSIIIGALGDVARASAGAADAEAVQKTAIEAIKGGAAKLQPRAMEAARLTLVALGDEQGADKLAEVRFADRAQADGSHRWGLVVMETATCKKDKVQQRVHVGTAGEPGNTWPDQMKARVEPSIGSKWPTDLIKACKGEGKVEIYLSPEPLKSAEEINAWNEQQLKSLIKPDMKVPRFDRGLLEV